MELVTTGPSRKIADAQVTWANSSAAGTERLVDFGSPAAFHRPPGAALLVVVRNPSSVTDLTGEVQVEYTDGGTVRYAKLTTFTAARANAGGEAFLIEGGLLAEGGQLSLKNATVLGGADTFSARVVVYAY